MDLQRNEYGRFQMGNGEWDDVIFSNVGTYEFNTDLEWMRENIPVNPHVLRKLHPWKEDLFAAIDCESESGGIRCNNDFYGDFRFVEDTRRFQLYYVPGYLEDDRNVTPYMEIGICNYQGKNAWAQ